MNNRSISTQDEFEIIYKQYFNPLVNFINGYISNREDCKEIVQNVFVKLWENRETLSINIQVKGYIFQAAKNAMIDYIRRNKKYEKNEDISTAVNQKILDVEESKLDPFLIRQVINHAAKKFKSTTHEIFMLYFFEGLTQEEIASYLKISKRKVEYQLSLSLENLRIDLKDHHILF